MRDPITHRFIGHAMKAHSLVGPGMNKAIYHQQLVAALTAAGIPHLSKPRRDLVYRGIVADSFEPESAETEWIWSVGNGSRDWQQRRGMVRSTDVR